MRERAADGKWQPGSVREEQSWQKKGFDSVRWESSDSLPLLVSFTEQKAPLRNKSWFKMVISAGFTPPVLHRLHFEYYRLRLQGVVQ